MHLGISKLGHFGPDNGLLLNLMAYCLFGTNPLYEHGGVLLIRPWGTNFNGILIKNATIFIQEIEFENLLQNGIHFMSASMC